jgi:transcriptional regulator with XRE-family HTH domain
VASRRSPRRQARAAKQEETAGELLRRARARASLTQQELAGRLDCSQQAIAQAERRQSNPTIGFMRRWAAACGGKLTIRIRPRSG